MITPLIQALLSLRVEVSAEEVADAVWLALHMRSDTARQEASLGSEAVGVPLANVGLPPEPSPRRETTTSGPQGGTVQQEQGVGARRIGMLAAMTGSGREPAGEEATPLRSPAAQGLPGALELARALRPLRRRVASSRRTVFDAEATVRRIAEAGLWLPVMRPALTRWLDLALVVDDGASMCIWRQTVAEFRRLLERQGAFRDLRVWRLQTDSPDGEVRLYAGARTTPSKTRELIDPTGRRLILLVTDCIAPAWDGELLPAVLNEWGRRSHVALVQVLPQRLWSQTALAGTRALRVRPRGPGTLNLRLRREGVGWGADPDADVTPFPVLRLESASAGTWAKAVAGTGGVTAHAVAFTGRGSKWDDEPEDWAEPDTTEGRVRSFRLTASDTAYELALLLAAAPLTLPVMRLVQQALLPESRHEHLAEVLLGGLLRREESEEGEDDPEAIEYDFLDGVRELLLDTALVPNSLKVLHAVSEYIERRFGQMLDFQALLLHPTVPGGVMLGRRNRAFAKVASQVLRRLGGNYARIADAMGSGRAEDFDEASSPDLTPLTHGLLVPHGLKLRRTLRSVRPGEMAWSADGELLAVAGPDGVIDVWSSAGGQLVESLLGPAKRVTSLAWWPGAGHVLASAYEGGEITFWKIDRGVLAYSLEPATPGATSIDWMPDGSAICWSSSDGRVYIREAPAPFVREPKPRKTSPSPKAIVLKAGPLASVIVSPDGHLLAASAESGTRLILAELTKRRRNTSLKCPSRILSLAWSPDGSSITAGCEDGIIRTWDGRSGKLVSHLEGHTDVVDSVSYSADGRLLASRSSDGTTYFWRRDTNEVTAIIKEQPPHFHIDALAFHPRSPVIATQGIEEGAVRIWELDLDVLLDRVPVISPVLYTTAKIALVGDSGVGKTGLGWRLAHGEFKEHPSTHGQQFWVIDELGATRADGTQCEAVLWDLAGQPDYRLVHALFLDDIDLALVVFDPTNRQEPLKGVEYWLRHLMRERQDGRRRRTILVGGRGDRGVPTLTRGELEEFCMRHGVEAYVGTSALTGEGLEELLARVKTSIVWDEMPATVTTVTFKRVKDFVLSLKESTEGRGVLVSPDDLRARLEATDADWEFTDAEMMTAVNHLANHGYVSVLRGSSGEETILLAPDLLANLAASFVLETRRNEKGLGALEESRVLEGRYEFPELRSLEKAERGVLLDAAVVLFIEHNLCFRETLGAQTLLIFPALINQKRPRLEEAETVDDYSYRVTGAVENVYAALVVQLGYTNTFTRTNQWQNQAEYETARGDVCGFRQVEEREGETEFVLYYAKEKAGARLLFQGLFEQFLRGRDVTVTKFPSVECPTCGSWQQRTVVVKRISEGKGFLFCDECGTKVTLPNAGEVVALGSAEREQMGHERELTRMRTAFESALVRVKAVARDESKSPPSCFISYAWGDDAHERWVRGFARDIENAGVRVTLDRKDNPEIGMSVSRFVSRIEESDFVVVVGTPLFRLKYENEVYASGSVVAAEVNLINMRLTHTSKEAGTVLPLLLEGDEKTSLPPLMRGKVYADFRRDDLYFPSLFDLVLTLYGISFTNPAVIDLRDSLRAGARLF